MEKKKLSILIGVIVFIILAFLILAFYPVKRKPVQQPITSPPPEESITKEIYGFSAEIKSIEGDILVLEGTIPLEDLTKEPIKKTVRARVLETTKITKLKFPEKITQQNQPVYPQEIPIKLSDLRVGDEIHIAATSNIAENIKNNTEINLNTIFIIEK